MRVHAFLATAGELPRLLDAGAPPAPGPLLTGVEKAVESLAELAVARGPEQELYLWVADGP